MVVELIRKKSWPAGQAQ